MEDFDIISTPERTIIHFSDYGMEGVCRLGKYAYREARKGLPKHIHEGMIEICYCEKGVQVYEVNGQRYEIRGGDIFITFPGETHSTDNYPEEKGSLYWLLLKISDEEGFLHHNKADGEIFRKELMSIPNRHFKGHPSMKKMLDAVFDLYQAIPQKPVYRLQVLNLLTGFVLKLLQCEGNNSKGIATERITGITNFITENIYEELSIEQLAKKMHMSASHFKSWFKKETGMPPLDYILRTKIEEAKKMLKNSGGLQVSDIAFRLNFSSSQYFATVFKKYTGMSPVDFRKSQ